MLAFSNRTAGSRRQAMTFRLARLYSPRASDVDGRPKRGGRTAPPCLGDGHRRADAKRPCGVIAGGDNSPSTPLLWVGTDDEGHIIIKPMMQRFHRRKECIEVAVNQLREVLLPQPPSAPQPQQIIHASGV